MDEDYEYNVQFSDVYYPKNYKEELQKLYHDDKYPNTMPSTSHHQKAVLLPANAMNKTSELTMNALNDIDLDYYDRVVIFAPVMKTKNVQGLFLPNFRAVKMEEYVDTLNVDLDSVDNLLDNNFSKIFHVDSSIFQNEYSWEVQIPFLIYKNYKGDVLPILVGDLNYQETNSSSYIHRLVDRFMMDPKTLIILSVDFCKYGRSFDILIKSSKTHKYFSKKEALEYVKNKDMELMKVLMEKNTKIFQQQEFLSAKIYTHTVQIFYLWIQMLLVGEKEKGLVLLAKHLDQKYDAQLIYSNKKTYSDIHKTLEVTSYHTFAFETVQNPQESYEQESDPTQETYHHPQQSKDEQHHIENYTVSTPQSLPDLEDFAPSMPQESTTDQQEEEQVDEHADKHADKQEHVHIFPKVTEEEETIDFPSVPQHEVGQHKDILHFTIYDKKPDVMYQKPEIEETKEPMKDMGYVSVEILDKPISQKTPEPTPSIPAIVQQTIEIEEEPRQQIQKELQDKDAPKESFQEIVVERPINADTQPQQDVSKPDLWEMSDYDLAQTPFVVLVLLKHVFSSWYKIDNPLKRIVLNKNEIQKIWNYIRTITMNTFPDTLENNFVPGMTIDFFEGDNFVATKHFRQPKVVEYLNMKNKWIENGGKPYNLLDMVALGTMHAIFLKDNNADHPLRYLKNYNQICSKDEQCSTTFNFKLFLNCKDFTWRPKTETMTLKDIKNFQITVKENS